MPYLRCAAIAFSLTLVLSTLDAAQPCGFQRAFQQPDEQGSKKVSVFAGKVEPSSGNHAPVAFLIPDLKINTDGTRISYKADDPRGEHGAINNIANALRRGHTIAEFEALARNQWEPIEETWRVLSANVIEKDTRLRRTNKPCVLEGNYLVSKTATGAVADAAQRDGDCDQSKWLDALTVPALVLPGGSAFSSLQAEVRSLVVVMRIDPPRRIAYGIVGDTGPSDELGEASVAMNRILNGLPESDVPRNYADAKQRFGGPGSAVLIFTGPRNLAPYPLTAERVMQAAKARFEAWGGQARLAGCLAEIQ